MKLKKLLSAALITVMTFGLNTYIAYAAEVTPMVAGMAFLKSNGTVWYADSKYYSIGELTDDEWKELSLIQIDGLTDIKAIYHGSKYYALKEDGTVWNFDLKADPTLKQIQGISDVKDIYTFNNTTIALKNDGTIWWWGEREYADVINDPSWGIPNMKTIKSDTPVKIDGIDNVEKIISDAEVIKGGNIWSINGLYETVDRYMSSDVPIKKYPDNIKVKDKNINEDGAFGYIHYSVGEKHADGTAEFIEYEGIEKGVKDVEERSTENSVNMSENKDKKTYIYTLNSDNSITEYYVTPPSYEVINKKVLFDNILSWSTDSGIVAVKNDGSVWRWGSKAIIKTENGKGRKEGEYIETPVKANNINLLAGASAQQSSAPVQQTSDKVTVKINGKTLSFANAQPTVINGRTLVPMRDIFAELGAEINWDPNTKTVTASKNGSRIKLTIGSTKASLNADELTLDVPPQIINGSTMVPLRFVSDSLGCEISWDQASKTAEIKQ